MLSDSLAKVCGDDGHRATGEGVHVRAQGCHGVARGGALGWVQAVVWCCSGHGMARESIGVGTGGGIGGHWGGMG